MCSEYHIARLYLAYQATAERRRDHEGYGEGYEKIPGLCGIVSQKCFREDRDEEDRSDERHKDDEVIQKRIHEGGYLEKFEVHDRFVLSRLDHIEQDAENIVPI